MKQPVAFELFSGGVPTVSYFRMQLDKLREIAELDSDDESMYPIQELCLIGLFAYFEAFCKDYFAAIINIEPSLISNLKSEGHNILVDATNIPIYEEEIQYRIGFILASKYDFGTAKKINSLYNSLINITPFSKEEIKYYNTLLRDRNLFIHHGGTYTISYLEQEFERESDKRRDAFYQSKLIEKEDLFESLDFIESIAHKIAVNCQQNVKSYLKENDIIYGDERSKALKFLGWTSFKPPN